MRVVHDLIHPVDDDGFPSLAELVIDLRNNQLSDVSLDERKQLERRFIKSYWHAQNFHKENGHKRREINLLTGELFDFFTHSAQLTSMMININASIDVLTTAPLHDMGDVSLDKSLSKKVHNIFGDVIGNLYDLVTTISSSKPGNAIEKKDEKDISLIDSLKAMIIEPDVTLLKLCDRHHNFLSFDTYSWDQKVRIYSQTKETLYPIARLVDTKLAYYLREELEKHKNAMNPFGRYQDFVALQIADDLIEQFNHFRQEHTGTICAYVAKDKGMDPTNFTLEGEDLDTILKNGKVNERFANNGFPPMWRLIQYNQIRSWINKKKDEHNRELQVNQNSDILSRTMFLLHEKDPSASFPNKPDEMPQEYIDNFFKRPTKLDVDKVSEVLVPEIKEETISFLNDYLNETKNVDLGYTSMAEDFNVAFGSLISDLIVQNKSVSIRAKKVQEYFEEKQKVHTDFDQAAADNFIKKGFYMFDSGEYQTVSGDTVNYYSVKTSQEITRIDFLKDISEAVDIREPMYCFSKEMHDSIGLRLIYDLNGQAMQVRDNAIAQDKSGEVSVNWKLETPTYDMNTFVVVDVISTNK